MFKLSDIAHAPTRIASDGLARLRLALSERRPAAALTALDALESQLSPGDVWAIYRTIWAQAGSLRALAGLGACPGELGELGAFAALHAPPGIEEALERGAFGEVDLPRLDPDALALVRDSAANAGRAAELCRAQLALAECAERVDQRVGLVEAVQAIAQTLDDRVLSALVEVFLARLDADFGDAEDAVERVSEVLDHVTPEEAPLVTALALMVRANVLQRAPVPTPSGTTSKADRTPHALDASLPERLWALGWQDGYPGATWGLGLPSADLS